MALEKAHAPEQKVVLKGPRLLVGAGLASNSSSMFISLLATKFDCREIYQVEFSKSVGEEMDLKFGRWLFLHHWTTLHDPTSGDWCGVSSTEVLVVCLEVSLGALEVELCLHLVDG